MPGRTVEELLGEYLAFSSRNDPAEIVQFNKVKELLGEAFADIAMSHKFDGQIQVARGVLNRGAKGPPIFDRVYSLGDDRILLSAEEGFAIVDAKFGESEVKRTNFNRSYMVTSKGEKIRLPQKRQARQLEAGWIRDRIDELATAERKAAASGRVPDASLAARLKRAADEGKLDIYEVRTTLEFGDDLVPDVHVEIVDHTSSVREAYRTGRREPLDTEGIAARKESIENFYLKRAELKAKIAAEADDDVQGRLKKARAALSRAKRDLAKAKKPATREERKLTVDEKRRAAEDLEAKAKRVKVAAREAEDVRRLNERLRDIQTNIRKSEQARKRQVDRAAIHAEKDATRAKRQAAAGELSSRGTAETAAMTDDARGVASRVANDAVTARATVDKIAHTAAQADRVTGSVARKGLGDVAPRQTPKIAEKGGQRTVARLALKGGCVVRTVGTYAYRVLNLTNPVSDLLMIVDGIDLLVNWLRRDKIEDEREWRRIAEFLSAETRQVLLPPYFSSANGGVPAYMGSAAARSMIAAIRKRRPAPAGSEGFVKYLTSQEASITTLAGNVLSGQIPGRTDDFMTWYIKWNTDTQWSGFVYTTVWINLERQRVLGRDYPFEYTYWLTDRLEVALSEDPPPNTKTEKHFGEFGPSEPRNRITRGRPKPYSDPDHNLSVEIRELEVRYTYSTPVLTPFDFILVKCNSLVGDLVSLLSRYDNTVVEKMDVRSEIAPGITHNWFANYTSGEPINAKKVKDCFSALLWISDELGKHSPMVGDSTIPKYRTGSKPNTGYDRRHWLLQSISGLSGSKFSFRQIAFQLAWIINPGKNNDYLIKPVNQDLDYLTPEYLARSAMEIHDDVLRALKACKGPPANVEYNYQGPAPRPRR